MEDVKKALRKFLGTWEDTGVLPNLPLLENEDEYKGFLILICRQLPNPLYTTGIIALDDNLRPKGLVGYVFGDIRFKIDENVKENVKEKEFRIEKLDTKLTAYLYCSNKYLFKIKINKDLGYYEWCEITITKK